MVLIIIGILALVVSVFLFKQSATYGNEAVEITKSKRTDTQLASQLFRSETKLRIYAIGFVIVGVVLIGYHLRSLL